MHLGSILSLFLSYLESVRFSVLAPRHYIGTSDRLCGVRLAVPPATNPVKPTCPSAEEVHAGKGSLWKLIRPSPSECGARTETRYKDRICGVERQDEVEREDVFLSMTRKLRIPCQIMKPSKSL
jgi:hypothetical protein